MFNSQILDVAIGLVFLYFFLSLFCSVIIEGITSLIKKRPRMLSEAIALLLGGDEKTLARFYEQPLFMGNTTPGNLVKSIAQSLLTLVPAPASKLETPKVPSFISSRSFVLSLLESLKKHPDVISKTPPLPAPKTAGELQEFETKINALPPEERDMKQALLPLLATASSDPDKTFESIKKWYDEQAPKLDSVENIQKMINKLPDDNKIKQALVPLLELADNKLDKALESMEKWYDEAMARVTGWYKRYAQSFALVLALLVALALNADTFAVGKAFYNDQALRSSVIAMAEGAGKQLTPKKDGEVSFDPKIIKAMGEELRTMRGLNLPLGWHKWWEQSKGELEKRGIIDQEGKIQGKPQFLWFWLSNSFLGILFTAFMVSLGSNFWFELMNKLINMRNAGKKPMTQEEAAQKK